MTISEQSYYTLGFRSGFRSGTAAGFLIGIGSAAVLIGLMLLAVELFGTLT